MCFMVNQAEKVELSSPSIMEIIISILSDLEHHFVETTV